MGYTEHLGAVAEEHAGGLLPEQGPRQQHLTPFPFTFMTDFYSWNHRTVSMYGYTKHLGAVAEEHACGLLLEQGPGEVEDVREAARRGRGLLPAPPPRPGLAVLAQLALHPVVAVAAAVV